MTLQWAVLVLAALIFGTIGLGHVFVFGVFRTMCRYRTWISSGLQPLDNLRQTRPFAIHQHERPEDLW
jgi:hypothetical protein